MVQSHPRKGITVVPVENAVNTALSSQIKLRLPHDLKSWVEQESEINKSSQNSEVIRALRERQERTTAIQRREETP